MWIQDDGLAAGVVNLKGLVLGERSFERALKLIEVRISDVDLHAPVELDSDRHNARSRR